LKSDIGKHKTFIITFLVDSKHLFDVVEDVHLFCCSFVKEEVASD